MPVKTKNLKVADANDAQNIVDSLEGWAGDIAESVGSWSKTWEDGMADLAERLDNVESRGQRIPTEKADAQRGAFEAFIRGGKASLTDQHRNALISADDTQGGYLTAPPAVESGILKELTQLSPIRRYATVRSISSPGATQAKLISDAEAWWVGETETRKETSLSFGRDNIGIHTLAAKIAVSIEHLQDSAYDVIGEITQAFGRAFAKKESFAFIKGDGHQKPLGILNTPGVETVKSGHATDLTLDGLLDLAYDLPGVYADSAVYLANRATIGNIRKKKASDGHYLWQDSLQAGTPPSFNSRPLVEDPELPNIAAGAKPVLFGDLKWFRIYDKVNSLQILRDDYTMADNGLVLFRAQRRVGAGLVMPSAIRVQTVEAN